MESRLAKTADRKKEMDTTKHGLSSAASYADCEGLRIVSARFRGDFISCSACGFTRSSSSPWEAVKGCERNGAGSASPRGFQRYAKLSGSRLCGRNTLLPFRAL